MKRLLYDVFVITLVSAGAGNAFAKPINLYAEPKTDSKIAGTIDTEVGVTIVYTPKSGEWIKVANPGNGDVGWVKSSNLGGNGYTMRIFTSLDGTRKYSVYQFGTGNSQLNQKQIENELQHVEQQQRMMQIYTAHMFNDMFYFPPPVFIPVIMLPDQTKLQKASSSKALPANSSSSNNIRINKN